MSGPVPPGTSTWSWPVEVRDAIDALLEKETRAGFEHLGRVLFELWPDVLVFAREATSQSALETSGYKEEPPQAITWHHLALDHFPEPHGTPACLAMERGETPVELAEGSEDEV